MEAACDRCHTTLTEGGIVFTPHGVDQKQQNLCVACFESMSSTDIQSEKAV